MNNTLKFSAELDQSKVVVNNNVKLSKDNVVGATLESLMSDPKYKELVKEITSNTRRGLGFRLKVGELVAFKDKSELPMNVLGFETFKGKLMPSVSAWVNTSNQGTVEFPMSIFRKIPSDIDVDLVVEDDKVVKTYVHDEDHYQELIENGNTVKTVNAIEYLCTDNPVGNILMKPIDDFKRALLLAGKIIECIDKVYLFKPAYDEGKRVQGKYEPMVIYKFRFVEATDEE